MSDEIAQRAFQTALAMDHERTLSAIQGRVRAFAAPFGFDRFVLFSASATAEAGIEHIYWVEGDWFGDGEAVDALTYVRHCPVTRHMLRVSEPFSGPRPGRSRANATGLCARRAAQACTACRFRCSARPVWRAPSAWGASVSTLHRRCGWRCRWWARRPFRRRGGCSHRRPARRGPAVGTRA